MTNLDCRNNDCTVSWESVSEHKRKSLKGWDLLAMREGKRRKKKYLVREEQRRWATEQEKPGHQKQASGIDRVSAAFASKV